MKTIAALGTVGIIVGVASLAVVVYNSQFAPLFKSLAEAIPH